MFFCYMLHDKTITVLEIMLFFSQYVLYLNGTCQELSNDISHDSLSQMYQKLVTYPFFF